MCCHSPPADKTRWQQQKGVPESYAADCYCFHQSHNCLPRMLKGLPSSRYKTAKSGSDQQFIELVNVVAMKHLWIPILDLYWIYLILILLVKYQSRFSKKQSTNGNFQPTALGPTGSAALVGTALGTASPESIRRISFVSPTISRLRFVRLERVTSMAASVCSTCCFFRTETIETIFPYTFWLFCLMMFDDYCDTRNSCNGKQWRHVFWSSLAFDNRNRLETKSQIHWEKSNNQLMVNWCFGLVLWDSQGTLTLAIILFIRGSQESKPPINH